MSKFQSQAGLPFTDVGHGRTLGQTNHAAQDLEGLFDRLRMALMVERKAVDLMPGTPAAMHLRFFRRHEEVTDGTGFRALEGGIFYLAKVPVFRRPGSDPSSATTKGTRWIHWGSSDELEVLVRAHADQHAPVVQLASGSGSTHQSGCLDVMRKAMAQRLAQVLEEALARATQEAPAQAGQALHAGDRSGDRPGGSAQSLQALPLLRTLAAQRQAQDMARGEGDGTHRQDLATEMWVRANVAHLPAAESARAQALLNVIDRLRGTQSQLDGHALTGTPGTEPEPLAEADFTALRQRARH